MKQVSKAEAATEGKDVQAVAFLVNSPGGSPVYSSLMGERVAAFAKNRKVPLYTFAEDYAASGGYWLLCMGKSTSKLSSATWFYFFDLLVYEFLFCMSV